MIKLFKMLKHKYKMWQSPSYRMHYYGKMAMNELFRGLEQK